MGAIEGLQELENWYGNNDPEITAAIEEIRQLRATVHTLSRELGAMHDKKESRKPCGPLKKVALREALAAYIGKLYECETEQELDDLIQEHAALRRQGEVDASEWMEGLNSDMGLGIYAREERVRELCMKENTQ